jgi:hypothetical protein
MKLKAHFVNFVVLQNNQFFKMKRNKMKLIKIIIYQNYRTKLRFVSTRSAVSLSSYLYDIFLPL